MFVKLQLWKARRDLLTASRHEAEMRESAAYMRQNVLPDLERKLEKLEVKDFFRQQAMYLK